MTPAFLLIHVNKTNLSPFFNYTASSFLIRVNQNSCYLQPDKSHPHLKSSCANS
jgi:hypothetical protein